MSKFKDEIKANIVRKGYSMRQLALLLSSKLNKSVTVQNLSNKLSNETIKYKEILQIADVLGYEIRWVDKEIK